ncbi:MAG TPA: helix-turn-helix transcriptional regulator [Acidiferrobacterales bacterium]|nr:helix-turn-helix transcriptional regulator [Acidiferrobacterales bacterium]
MAQSARQVLAAKIKLLRFLRRWSQEDLAAAAGLHRTYISAIERATCNLSLGNVEKLARAFGLSAWELLHPDASLLGAAHDADNPPPPDR